MKKVIPILFLLLNCMVLAQGIPREEFDETAIENAVKDYLSYDKNEAYIHFDLKKLPGDDVSVAAVTQYNGIPEDGFVDLILILIDNTSLKILNKHIEEKKFTSDAIGLSGVALDIAKYIVADGVRAFGIRDNYVGSSGPNPYGQGNISLYIIKNNTFELVLDQLETYKLSGEWDMRCTYEGYETNSVLIMQKEKTNGYYNIKVKSIKTLRKTTAPQNKDDDCLETETKLKPTYKTLQFVKGKYQLKE